MTVVGFGVKPSAEVEFISIDDSGLSFSTKITWALKLVFRMFESYYWCLPWVKDTEIKGPGKAYDLYVANDISSLPLTLKLAAGRTVLFDAHEYSPREFEDRFKWRLFFKKFNSYICEKYIPQVSSMLTVCDGIAQEYNKNYGVMPRVIYNAPNWQGLSPRAVDSKIIKMIHHGVTTPSRHLESMMEIMGLLDDRFELDLMLIETDTAYMAKLKNLAAQNSRIKFIPPVPMPEISKTINNYDIGIYLLPPVNFNHEHALPNKFFEFIQANLAVVIGPSPEMANIVNKYQCGIVTDTFEPSEMAAKLNALTAEDIYRFKLASGKAAKELGFETSAEVLLSEVDQLLQTN